MFMIKNLKIVFWDYDKFQDEDFLLNFIKEHKNDNLYFWIMARFLERGYVVDTLKIFSIEEIEKNIDNLKISDRARKKWKRMIEVYGRK